MKSSGETGEMGKKREGVAAELKLGERGPDVAGEVADLAGDVGVERENGGFKFESRPLRAHMRAGRCGGEGGDVGRTRERRGVGAGGAEEAVARRFRRQRLELRLQRPEVGDDRQVGPTCRRPERGGRGGLGRPTRRRGRGRGMGRRPNKEKGGKRKEKEKKDFHGIKNIALAQF
uniref:Uncharacterized protein n=1 Tax=Oryza sativa subsp. japonica TaxID=39947 RepID=Q69PA0_ORYSJ|nr:hypothetical protein [Oryza sativa Japonica Group]BAD36134.1 hypothetical protein [Oryza sativa Japonica Group]